MERHLEESKIWTRLFDRAMALVTDLDSCGLSESEADRRVYPVFARLVYEDCVFMASTYERLVALRFRRVVHQLIGLFLGRFIEEVPRGALPDAEAKKLADLLGPVQRRRQEALHNLDEAIEQVEKTVDEICRMGSLSERLRAHSESSASRRRLELLERIAERAPQGLREEIESLVAELEAETDLATTYRPQIERLLRDLLEHSGQAATASVLETLTLDQLRARCDALLDPLTT